MRNISIAPVRRAHVLRAAAAAALLIGYIDLARGGITVAPLFIVFGYAVLVPAVILTWR
ncbi:MAG: hypothetical protein ABI969_05435 [bacterium]